MRIKINNNSNTVQAVWLGLGSFVSFSFGIISAAILSRYLSKADYGTYKQVLYVYNTLLVVFSLGLPRAYSYFLARVPIEAGYSIVRKINLMFLIIGIVFSLFLCIGSSFLADVLNNSALKECLQLFAITPIFLLPLMGIESIMATYRKAYINTIYVIGSRFFSLVCVVLPVILFDSSVYVAIVGFVFSSVLCCILGLFLERIPFRQLVKIPTQLEIKDILKYSFPLLLASVWGIVITSSTQFFISRYWGNETFAEFSNGFIELPFASMVISASATVLLPVFSKMVHERSTNTDIVNLWKSVAIKSSKIIFPLAIFACVFAKLIMIFLYGEEYMESSVYFQIITIVNLVRIVPYAPVVLALGKVKEYAHVHFITALGVVVLEYLMVLLFPDNPYMVVWISVWCTIISLYLQIKIVCNALNIPISQLVPYKKLGVILLCSCLAAVLTKIFLLMLPMLSISLSLIVSGLVFVILYIIICKVIGISYVEIVMPILNRSEVH